MKGCLGGRFPLSKGCPKETPNKGTMATPHLGSFDHGTHFLFLHSFEANLKGHPQKVPHKCVCVCVWFSKWCSPCLFLFDRKPNKKPTIASPYFETHTHTHIMSMFRFQAPPIRRAFPLRFYRETADTRLSHPRRAPSEAPSGLHGAEELRGWRPDLLGAGAQRRLRTRDPSGPVEIREVHMSRVTVLGF